MTVILMIMLVKIVVIDCVDNYHILYTCRCSEPGPEKRLPSKCCPDRQQEEYLIKGLLYKFQVPSLKVLKESCA